MKPLLLANNSNEYPGLFSAIQHKQQNVVETVYLALSDHAHLLDLLLKILWIFGNTKRHKNTLPLSWLLNWVNGLLLN